MNIERLIWCFTNGGEDKPYTHPVYDGEEIAGTEVRVADGCTLLEVPRDVDNPDFHEEIAEAVCVVGAVLQQQAGEIRVLQSELASEQNAHKLVEVKQAEEIKKLQADLVCQKDDLEKADNVVVRLQAELEQMENDKFWRGDGRLLADKEKIQQQAEEIDRLKGLLLWWETYIDTDETIRPPIEETRKALRKLKGETE